LPELFAIVRLPANAAVPSWAESGSFHSITRTQDELSIVCAAENVPRESAGTQRWHAFKVHGPFALSEIGVLAALARPLAAANVSIFVISTFETDYVFVNSEQFRNAADVLVRAGHTLNL
jgi:hypothetical protein